MYKQTRTAEAEIQGAQRTITFTAPSAHDALTAWLAMHGKTLLEQYEVGVAIVGKHLLTIDGDPVGDVADDLPALDVIRYAGTILDDRLVGKPSAPESPNTSES